MRSIEEAIAWGEAKINEGGTYYEMGGNGPKGYDCSHFVASCFNVTYYYTGAMVSGYTKMGFTHYSYGSVSLQRGDVLVWNEPGTSGAGDNGHTAIYVGGGKYLQSRGGVGPDESTANANLGWQDILRPPGSASAYCTNMYVAAAICGNFWRESNINPGVWESLTPTTWDHQYAYDGIGGYGLGQWTNVDTPHGRCYNLHTWVTSNGYKDGDGNGQMAFVIYENVWSPSNYSGAHSTLRDFLKSTSTNLNALTEEWLACWEGVPGNALAERQSNAAKVYSYLSAHQNDSVSWISSNNYLSESQIYNNAVCVWQWLNGHGSPSGGGLVFVSWEPD